MYCTNEDPPNSSLRYSNQSTLGNNSEAAFLGWNSESNLSRVVKLIVQVFIAVLGVIGNILVVAVINRLGKKKSSVDFYILNLAIADLGTLLLTFPLAVVREKLPMEWPFGEFTCLYVYPIPEVFYGSSVWCIAVIAIERYRSIVKIRAARNKHKSSLKSAKMVAASVWFASFLLFSLPLYFVVRYREHKGMQWCGPVWPSWDCQLLLPRVYISVLTAFSFIIPLMVITWTYCAIAHKINKSSTFIKSMHRENADGEIKQNRPHMSRIEKIRLRQNRRAKRLLTPIAVVFAITMLPLNILRLATVFWPQIVVQEYYQTMFYTVAVFVIINSSVNPIVYSIVSNDFRQGIRRLFCCCRWGRSWGFAGFELQVFSFRSSKSWNLSHTAASSV